MVKAMASEKRAMLRRCGYAGQVTHRCHKKEFLLKFGRDRRRWLWWLFEARKRFGLSVLNYTVTSNHIDLNMVRAGVVKHPSQWPFGGYSEIQKPKLRYALINYDELKDLFNFSDLDELAEFYRGWIEEALKKVRRRRDRKWTESIAAGPVRALIAAGSRSHKDSPDP